MNIDKQLEILEAQLCQAIVWCEAIKAFSDAWNRNTALRHDHFIFGTVYDALWDAIIVKICTIWDNDENTVSFKSLIKELSFGNDFRKKIKPSSNDKHSNLAEIMSWRNQVVAHRAKVMRDKTNGSMLTDETFSQISVPHILIIESELAYIEELLVEARKLQGQSSAYFQCLKEDSVDDARLFVTQWELGVETRHAQELAAIMQNCLL